MILIIIKKCKNLFIQRRRLENDDKIIINPYKMIPESLRVSNVGAHFYRYGIHIYRPSCIGNDYRRNWYYNPLFILFMEFVYLFRSITAFFISAEPNENRKYFIYLGDYMYCIGAKTHINLAAICDVSIGISLLLLTIYNHHRGIRPTFLYSLDFLAGRITPSTACLNDNRYIEKLLIKTRWIVNYCEFNTRAVGIVSFILSAWPLWFECTTIEFLTSGLPWSIIFAISSYFTFSAYFWNMAYFYILCNFLCYRLREINDLVVRFSHLKLKQSGIRKLVNKANLRIIRAHLNRIGKDIQHFNNNYYKNVILIIVTLLGTFLNVVLYTALFVPVDLTIRFSLFYAVVLATSAICFLLNTASLVYNEAGVSRKVLNKFYISQIQNHNPCTLYNVCIYVKKDSVF
mgnify:FL=1